MTNTILAEITAYARNVSPSKYHVSVHDQMACARHAMHGHNQRGVVYTVELPDERTIFVAADERGAWFVTQWAADAIEHGGWFQESDRAGTPFGRVYNPDDVATADGGLVDWCEGSSIANGCPPPPKHIAVRNRAPKSLKARSGEDAGKRLTVSA